VCAVGAGQEHAAQVEGGDQEAAGRWAAGRDGPARTELAAGGCVCGWTTGGGVGGAAVVRCRGCDADERHATASIGMGRLLSGERLAPTRPVLALPPGMDRLTQTWAAVGSRQPAAGTIRARGDDPARTATHATRL